MEQGDLKNNPEYWRQQSESNAEIYRAFILAYEDWLMENRDKIPGNERAKFEEEMGKAKPPLEFYEYLAMQAGLLDQAKIIEKVKEIYFNQQRN